MFIVWYRLVSRYLEYISNYIKHFISEIKLKL